MHVSGGLDTTYKCAVLVCLPDWVFILQAKPAFFCKLLEVMTNDDIALCLSPQGFSNVDPATDIFNNTNQQFWE